MQESLNSCAVGTFPIGLVGTYDKQTRAQSPPQYPIFSVSEAEF